MNYSSPKDLETVKGYRDEKESELEKEVKEGKINNTGITGFE